MTECHDAKHGECAMKFKFSGNPHANHANPAKVGVDTSFQSCESHAKVCESVESLERIRKAFASLKATKYARIRRMRNFRTG